MYFSTARLDGAQRTLERWPQMVTHDAGPSLGGTRAHGWQDAG